MSEYPCTLVGPYAYDLNIQALWIEDVADPQEPTAAEIASGVDLQAVYNLTDIIGWEIKTELIRDGIWNSFEEQRLGRQSIADSSFILGADRSGYDIRLLLARGDAGFVALLPSGPHLDYPDAPVNIYPVRVAQLTQLQRLRTGGGSVIQVDFAITARCGENVLVVGS